MNNSKPSIFTARNSYIQKPTQPPLTRSPNARTSPPFQEQDLSDRQQPKCIQAEGVGEDDWPALSLTTTFAAFGGHTGEGASSRAVNIESAGVRPPPLQDSVLHKPGIENSQEGWASVGDCPGGHLLRQQNRSAIVRIEGVGGKKTPPGEFPPLVAVRQTTTSGSAGDIAQGKKREASAATPGHTFESVSKRRRFLGSKTKNTLEGFTFGPSAFNQPALQPPSPLFFSNSPKPRPQLPPRFSSSEAAARMLSKARSEDSHITTVSLARGTVTTPALGINQPHHATPTSVLRPAVANRESSDRSIIARSSSPDTTASSNCDTSNVLNNIGVAELLEQDERPTLVVDLADSLNYGPGLLRLAFFNSALKSYPGMREMVSGLTPDEPKLFLQFKSWLLSASINGESQNVCLPSFVYAGLHWSCSTLRKRYRVISGAFLASKTSSNAPMSGSTLPLTSFASEMPTVAISSSAASMQEPSDYFAGAVTEQNSAPGSKEMEISTSAEVVPTVEPLPLRHEVILSPPNQLLYGATDLLPSPRTYVGPSQDPYAPKRNTPTYTSSRSIVDDLSSQIQTVPSDFPCFDWTRLPVTDTMPKHIRFARSVDWSSTSLGPIGNWNSDLRQMANLIMASPHPAAMYWGEDLIAIYNEAYVLLAGQKHPKLMGQSYKDAWFEIWDEVKDVFASAKATGQATMKDDDCLFIRRNSYLEETYFSWSIIPMVGRDGTVMGLYNPAFEKTRRKIAERRMLTLREVGERTASARDVKGFWEKVLGSFEYNEYDSPFLLLYSVSDETDSDASSIHSNSVVTARQCFLEGSLGVTEGHAAAPDQIDLKAGMEGFGPVFREVMKTNKPLLLEVGSRDLPESLLENVKFRGFGDACRAVVVCPIHPTTYESTLGFLVLGVNPRRPYDDDYNLFVQLLSRQLATSLASVVLFEEEIKRGQKAAKLAALDRIKLSEQLAERTKEAIESETKFTRMAEFAPVGMFIADSAGRITFANDTWYDISRVPKTGSINNTADMWMDCVADQDRELVKRLWADLVENKRPVSSEFRFKAQWEDRRSGGRMETWVLFSAYPERNEDGRLKSVFGSITNISQQKWAEGIQTRKMEEAMELKRQQENFIDITSHEMRNPLSAILQCCDEIASGLTKFRQGDERVMPDELLSSCLDAAQIINLCSQHQKRIVDDILTLSKLDSQLLLVTPIDAQPLTIVQRALKMHEGELHAADIQMKFVVDQSYRDLDLDWVRLDPSRVLQVLINLTTNAIKFTGTESKRTITITISASKQRPSQVQNPPVKYFPALSRQKNSTSEDTIFQSEWGDGEIVYIHFSVKDTGRGLSLEEKKMLFQRFSQASPRTHVQYGGSGLGLFISRELTELQGGEIGVESEAGRGSTFAFYVLARRSKAPSDSDNVQPSKREDAHSKSLPSTTSKKTVGQIAWAQPRNVIQDNIVPQSPLQQKVLIVEDNLVNQRVLQRQLRNLGTEVHLANHGGEALEKLKQSTYWAEGGPTGKLELGVVLMDQEMPVMDGLTCTKIIRALEQEGKLTGHVPIIAVTANARAEQIQTALEAGMDDVVSKPFRIPELVPKIEELMLKYPMPRAS